MANGWVDLFYSGNPCKHSEHSLEVLWVGDVDWCVCCIQNIHRGRSETGCDSCVPDEESKSVDGSVDSF